MEYKEIKISSIQYEVLEKLTKGLYLIDEKNNTATQPNLTIEQYLENIIWEHVSCILQGVLSPEGE